MQAENPKRNAFAVLTSSAKRKRSCQAPNQFDQVTAGTCSSTLPFKTDQHHCLVVCSPPHTARVLCVQEKSLGRSSKTMQRNAMESQLMYLHSPQMQAVHKTFSWLPPKQKRSNAASRVIKVLKLHQQAPSSLSQQLQMLYLISWPSSASKVRLWSSFLSICQTKPGRHTGGQKAQKDQKEDLPACLLKVIQSPFRKPVQARPQAASRHVLRPSGQCRHRS